MTAPVVLIFFGLMILLGIVIFSAPSVLTFLLYRRLKTKGETKRKIGIAIFSITTLAMLLLVIKIINSPSGFGPEYDTALIDQKIGGKLFCKSVYNADIHSWQFNIDYKYIPVNGDTIDMGSGGYYGREWNKDEQLIKLDNWLILKTGYIDNADKVVLKNTVTDSIYYYNFDNEFIEKDSLWKTKNIKSLLNCCCAETFIKNISGDKIQLTYKFRTDETLTKKYDQRTITYRIDRNTGQIKMALKEERT